MAQGTFQGQVCRVGWEPHGGVSVVQEEDEGSERGRLCPVGYSRARPDSRVLMTSSLGTEAEVYSAAVTKGVSAPTMANVTLST